MRDFPLRITTKRTVLRKIDLKDAAAWKNFNNAIAKKMQWPIVPSIIYAQNEIMNYTMMWGKYVEYVYVVEQNNKVVGDVHIRSVKGQKAEFGIALHPKLWGTGIVYEVLDALKKIARQNDLILRGRVEDENIRSWKALEKSGAKFKGTKYVTINKTKQKMRVYEL